MNVNQQEAEERLKAGMKIIGGPPYGPWTDMQCLGDALTEFQEASAISPEFGLPRLYEGIIHVLKCDAAKANQSFEQAIAMMPQCAMAYVYRAWAQTDSNAANRYFRTAIQLSPNDWLPSFEMGRHHLYNGQYVTAIQKLGEAICKGAPARAYCLRGTAHQAEKNHAQAISDFTECIAAIPDWCDAYILRAQSYMDQGDEGAAAAAVNDYAFVIPRLPADDQTAIRRKLAFALIKDGRFQEAVSHLDLVIDSPEETTACDHYHRSIAQAHLGDYRTSIEDVETAISLDPNNHKLYRCRAAIRKLEAEGQSSPEVPRSREMDDLLAAIMSPGLDPVPWGTQTRAAA